MSDLAAGPELDRLIAEKVMGWTYAGVVQRTPGQGGPCDSFVDDRGKARWFMPSTRMECAWQAVERALGAHGLCIGRKAASWYCEIIDADIGDQMTHVEAATAPLVICRALLAVASPPPPTR